MPKITVEIEWDRPQDVGWLNADNVAVALHAYRPSTHFVVTDVTDKQPLLFSRCASIQMDSPNLCYQCSQQTTCGAVGFGTVHCSGYVPEATERGETP